MVVVTVVDALLFDTAQAPPGQLFFTTRRVDVMSQNIIFGTRAFARRIIATLFLSALLTCLASGIANASDYDMVPADAIKDSPHLAEKQSTQLQMMLTLSSETDPEDSSIESFAEAAPTWTPNGTCEWSLNSSGTSMSVRPSQGNDTGKLSSLPWIDYGNHLVDLEFTGKIMLPDSPGSQGYFFDMIALEEIRGIEHIDTSNITDMGGMFYLCNSLKRLDLSSFNTSNVVYMGAMFWGCIELEHLDMSGFDTANVLTMDHMFFSCPSLKSLDLSMFDTSSAQSMNRMFYDCAALTELDLSPFKTKNVDDMFGMFEECIALKSLDLSMFNTSKVINMGSMFKDCISLSSINGLNFDTSHVAKISSMFEGCSNLSALDISSFDTQNVTTCVNMFAKVDSLESISIGNGFTLESIFPDGKWRNENGAVFSRSQIPLNTAGRYTRIELIPTDLAYEADVSNETISKVVGCEPFWVSSGLDWLSTDGVDWSSSDPSVASVNRFGLVTVHSAGPVEIVAKYTGEQDSLGVMVSGKWFPSSSGSDIDASLVAWDSLTAKKLDGCFLQVKRSSLKNENDVLSDIRKKYGESSRMLDVLDLNVVDASGNIIQLDGFDNEVSVMFSPGYQFAYFAERGNWNIAFHHLGDESIVQSYDAYWFRDCEELAFDNTHLSTYLLTASPAGRTDNGGQDKLGAEYENAEPTSPATPTSSRTASGNLLASGDEIGIACIALCMAALIATCIGLGLSLRRRNE